MPADLASTHLMEPGVYSKHGVVWNDSMRSFAREVSRRLGSHVVVTSGVRTPRAQAEALAQDYAFTVYSQQDLVEDLKTNGLTVDQMTATLERQVARGRYLSRHMRADALDFRVRGLTGVEREALKGHAAALGGRVVDEGDHIHVERVTGVFGVAAEIVTDVAKAPLYVAMAVQEYRRGRPWVAPVALGTAGLLTAAIVLLLGLRRRR